MGQHDIGTASDRNILVHLITRHRGKRDPYQGGLLHVVAAEKALIILQCKAEVIQHTEPDFEILAEAVHIEAARAWQHTNRIPSSIPAIRCVGAAEPAAWGV